MKNSKNLREISIILALHFFNMFPVVDPWKLREIEKKEDQGWGAQCILFVIGNAKEDWLSLEVIAGSFRVSLFIDFGFP